MPVCRMTAQSKQSFGTAIMGSGTGKGFNERGERRDVWNRIVIDEWQRTALSQAGDADARSSK